MASRPFERVGERWSLRPMRSMKYRSAEAISSGVCPLSTRIRRAMMPFTMSASLSAVKHSRPSFMSAWSHTRLWQPSMRLSSVLYFASSGSSSLPRSMSSWYLSIQSVRSENSSITSSCASLIVIVVPFLILYYFLYLEQLVAGPHLGRHLESHAGALAGGLDG